MNSIKEVLLKQVLKRLIVLVAALALVVGVLPTDGAQAAKKKSKTSITVSTQEELVKALKSGKYKKITIKTDAKVSFTLAAKYSNSDLKIVVDAKNATFNSKGTVGSIVVNEAKTVKEYASGNKITVNDEKLTFKAMEGASVEKLKIASETGEVKVVNNGEIGRVDVTGESKVDVEQNGSVGRLYVAAAAEIGVTGTSEEKLAVTVKPEAAGAAVKSEIPVKVNAYADVDLKLEKGAENSAVTLKNEDAGVKLENNTDKKVTVTDSEGEKQTVKKGEDLTSDNYVGKAEETDDGTEGETSGTPSDETKDDKKEDEKKEEDKKEDKEEEKKDDTTSTGGSDAGTSGGGYYYNPPTAEETLIEDLKKAASVAANLTDGLEGVMLTTNVTLTGNITIPANVQLFIGYDGKNATLNADSYTITLKDNAHIIISPGCNLTVASKNMVYDPDNKEDWKEAWLGVEPGGEFKYGGVLFTVDGAEDVDDTYVPLCGISWYSYVEDHWYEDPGDPENPDAPRNSREVWNHFNGVEIQNHGGTITMSGDDGVGFDALPGIFGVDNYILSEPGERERFDNYKNSVSDDDVNLSFLNFRYLGNVQYTEFVTKFNDEEKYKWKISDTDWLNAYLDPNRAEEIEKAHEINNYESLKLEVSDRVVTIKKDSGTGAAAEITGELNIPAGSTLVTEVPLDVSEYGGLLTVMGTFKSLNDTNDGLGVISSVMANPNNKDPHELIKVCGWDGRIILNNGDEYFVKHIFPDEEDKNQNPENYRGWIWDSKCTFAIVAHEGNVIKWEYRSEDVEVTDNDVNFYRLHPIAWKITKNDAKGDEVIPNPFSNGFLEIKTLEQGGKSIEDKSELQCFFEWAEGVTWLYISETFDGDEDAAGISYEGFKKKDLPGGYRNLVYDKFKTSDTSGIELGINGVNKTGNPMGSYELNGVELTLTAPSGNNDTLRLEKGTTLDVTRGATLIVSSVASVSDVQKNNGKSLVLEYDADDDQNGARVSVKRGGSLQIGNIKMTVHATCTNDWDNDPGIALSGEYDADWQFNDAHIRLQIPASVIMTDVNTGETPTVGVLNNWMDENHIFIDFIDPKKIDDAEDGLDYFEVGDDYWFINRASENSGYINTISTAKVPAKGDDGYYEVRNREQLLALYIKSKDDSSVKVRVNHEKYTDWVIDTILYTEWQIEVPSGKNLTIAPGSVLKAGVTVVSGASVDVQVDGDGKFGTLMTAQDKNIEILEGGMLTVHNRTQDGQGVDIYDNECYRALIKSGNGGKVVVASGASFNLHGNFECACSNNQLLFEVENRDNVTGFGYIALVPDVDAAYASTENDYLVLKREVSMKFSSDNNTTRIGYEEGYGDDNQNP